MFWEGAKNANAFNRNALKIAVEEDSEVRLYPEADEPVNILNIKRGIISTFIAPMIEEERLNLVGAPAQFHCCILILTASI